ncbi:10520_t:CDS:10, partial [Acaulospora colombiana]
NVALAHYINGRSDETQKITIEWNNPSNNEKSNVELKVNNEKIIGTANVARYMARAYRDLDLYGSDAISATLIDQWIDFASVNLESSDFKVIETAWGEINHHLTLRTFFVGYKLTLADIILWGVLKSMRVIYSDKVKLQIPVLIDFSSFSLSFVQESLKWVSKSADASKPRKEQPNMNIGLTDAEIGKVVTRFPPEPSGYLHIGHAKAAMLNEYFAREYKGKLIVRFDDTNPSKEKEEFEESIKEDLALLGIRPDLVTYTSDHFEELYQYAVKIIKKGLAYVDDTDVNTNPNKALRDPVIYRCNLLPHHRTGNKWKIYPTYDFACPIVDSLEGVTHALRTNEYRDRNAQYEWMLNALDLRKVHIWDFSRMNFVYTLLSKRKLQWFVNQGLVSGWDDPRFPTVRGIRRRGMTIEALRQYILTQGASQNTVMLEWDKLWALNKSVIDPVAPRHTSILRKSLVSFNILGGPESPYSKDLPKHKKNADVGIKKTWFSSSILIDQDDAKTFEIGEEITLMDWGNAIVKALCKYNSGSEFIRGELQLHLEGDFKKTKKKITWLADTPEITKVVLVDYDYLINKRRLEENDQVEDYVTEKSEFLTDALADSNVRELKKGDIIQFERRGYYILDNDTTFEVPRFIRIPDGKAISMASKAGNEKENKSKQKDTIKMYNIPDIYGDVPVPSPEQVSKMYG